MYQVPPNPKPFKITLFSPTLLKLEVLFRWLTIYFPVQQIAKDSDPLCIKRWEKNLSLCMDIADEIEVATILEMQLSHYHFNPFWQS